MLDGGGNVVAAGSLLGSATSLDFAIALLDAATGRSESSCRFPRSCGGARPRFRVPTVGTGLLPRR